MAVSSTRRGDTRLEALAALLERFSGEDGTHATSLDALTIFRVSAPTEVMPVLYEPSLCVIAQGRKEVRLGDAVFHYDAAEYLLVSTDVAATGQVLHATPEVPYLSLRIDLDVATVADLVTSVDRSEAPPPAPARAMATSVLEPTLLDAITRLVALLERPADAGVLGPLVLREITYRLLQGEQGARLRQIAASDGHARRMVRALRWLKEHFREPLRIDDLARHLAMSPSALHHHFKLVTAMSPLQYQKHLRLHEARSLMLTEGLDATEASFRVGYESPSQFSREYRRLFGAPPGRDVRAIRRDVPPIEV